MRLGKVYKLLTLALLGITMIIMLNVTALAKQKTPGMSFELKSVQINSYRITYKIINGDAHNVLILQHGAFMNGDSMLRLANEVQRKFPDKKIIIPDIVNHREPTDNISDIDTLANIEKNFIEALKATKEIKNNATVGYAGWSMGGSIGLKLAIWQSGIKEKDRSIDYLAILSTSPVWDSIKGLPDFSEEEFLQIFPLMFRAEISSRLTEEEKELIMEELEEQLAPTQTCINDISALKKFDVATDLWKVDIPVLIVCGANDTIAGLNNQYNMKMEMGVSNEDFYIVDNEGHDIVIDNASYVADRIKSFVDSLERKVGCKKPKHKCYGAREVIDEEICFALKLDKLLFDS